MVWSNIWSVKYVVWVMLAVAALIAVPGVLRSMGNGGVAEIIAVGAVVVVVALIGNVFKIAKRVDEIAKRR